MATQSQRQVLLVNARAVIPDPDKLDTAGFKINIDTSAIRIKAVFKQFLDDRCRPLNNLASGNLIRQAGIQLHNTVHKDDPKGV
jgi:hypothetical protein